MGIVNIGVFQDYVVSGRSDGGFYWDITSEGEDFWDDVIRNMNFELFFDVYPRKYESK